MKCYAVHPTLMAFEFLSVLRHLPFLFSEGAFRLSTCFDSLSLEEVIRSRAWIEKGGGRRGIVHSFATRDFAFVCVGSELNEIFRSLICYCLSLFE